MIPSSKSKRSSTERVIPPLAGARTGGKVVPSQGKSGAAQPFRVWPDNSREQIAAKAYEFWEQRGCRHGYDLEDWLDAETAVRKTLPATYKSTDAGART